MKDNRCGNTGGERRYQRCESGGTVPWVVPARDSEDHLDDNEMDQIKRERDLTQVDREGPRQKPSSAVQIGGCTGCEQQTTRDENDVVLEEREIDVGCPDCSRDLVGDADQHDRQPHWNLWSPPLAHPQREPHAENELGQTEQRLVLGKIRMTEL